MLYFFSLIRYIIRGGTFYIKKLFDLTQEISDSSCYINCLFDLRILIRDDSDRFLEQFVIVGYCFRLYADARLHRKSVKAMRSPRVSQRSKRDEAGRSIAAVTDRGRCEIVRVPLTFARQREKKSW